MEDDMLKLLIKDAVRDGMDEHMKCHKELQKDIDETRRFMWGLSGAGTVLGAVFGRLLGGNH
jgi:hypothetical protein